MKPILVIDTGPRWANKHLPGATLSRTTAAALVELLTNPDAFGLVVIGPGLRRRLPGLKKQERREK